MGICFHKQKINMCSQKILNLGKTDHRLMTAGYSYILCQTNSCYLSLKQMKPSIRGERNHRLLPVVSWMKPSVNTVKINCDCLGRGKSSKYLLRLLHTTCIQGLMSLFTANLTFLPCGNHFTHTLQEKKIPCLLASSQCSANKLTLKITVLLGNAHILNYEPILLL